MRNIIRLSDMTERETLDILCAGNGAIRGVDRFDKRLDIFPLAFATNARRGLRIRRSTWIVRDNDCEWSRPSNLADWPECTIDDAMFELARHVWCDCVRVANGGEL